MKNRVVITGMGIVSCIGENLKVVLENLRQGRTGITHSREYHDMGFRSCVFGKPPIECQSHIDRRIFRFMSEGVGYGYIAACEAISDAGLQVEDLANERTGVVVGAGGVSTKVIAHAADVTRMYKNPKRGGPFLVPQTMGSSPSANLSVAFKTKGASYSISAACATSAHCIVSGCNLIQSGAQDLVIAGGVEELDWLLSALFDAMGAMSSKYNDLPKQASRPYDRDRDGFVIAGGAGIVILESYEHAMKRQAHNNIHGEIVGCGITSDGDDMVQPSSEGAVRCMEMALRDVNGPIDYINPHATSTQIGDRREIQALEKVFAKKSAIPPLSATKALSGHSLGAISAQEMIFSLLMMRHSFIAPSCNIQNLDSEFEGIDIVRTRRDNVAIRTFLSNSFGFGGTNASIAVTNAIF